MALKLDDFNGMELMWDKMSKAPDNDHVTLSYDDIDSMWHCGLVDTKQFSIEKWRAAFDGHKRPDGTFVLSREEFLAKEAYRYKGEILIPFDAMQINEGKYTDEGLNELFDLSIAPSCSLSAPELKRFIEDLKSKFRGPDGLVTIDKPAKIMIRQLLEENPSPLRRLELMFDYLIQQEQLAEAKGGKGTVTAPGHLTAQQLATLQTSSFSMHPTSDAESKHRALSKIQKTRPKTSAKPSDKEEKGVALKKVKRSRKGFRG